MKTIAAYWDDLHAEICQSLDEEAIETVKVAFYAGAAATLNLLGRQAKKVGDDVEKFKQACVKKLRRSQ